MRIFNAIFAAVLVGLAAAAPVPQAVADEPVQAAFERGLEAYKTGHIDRAIPALSEAAATGGEKTKFYAEFYLARIYSESAGGIASHPKAFMLFRKIADENAEVDPGESDRAPFVAKALIALAAYTRTGLREMDLSPNPRRAVDYLNHAATYFGDREAQVELAKAYLSGEPSRDDVRRGMHYLSTLSEESNPAAQALLAELFWRGRHVRKDEERALALVKMAVENAPLHDRMWIEDSYHSIFCGSNEGTRKGAESLISRWRNFFARAAQQPSDRLGLGGREILPDRQCADGEVAVRHGLRTGAIASAPPASPRDTVQGGAASFGFSSK
jgi:uncharacterized protein